MTDDQKPIPVTFENTGIYRRLITTAELMRSSEFRESLAIVPQLKVVGWRDGNIGFFSTVLPPSSGESSFRNIFSEGRAVGDYTTQHLRIPGAIRSVFPVWRWPERKRLWCGCLSADTAESLVGLPMFEGMCPHILAALLFDLSVPAQSSVLSRAVASYHRHTVLLSAALTAYTILYDPKPAGSALVRNLLALAQVGKNPLDVMLAE